MCSAFESSSHSNSSAEQESAFNIEIKTLRLKERDEWSGLAQFIGNMIAKYADEIDFDSLPNPDIYLMKKGMRKVYLDYGRKRMEIIKNKNDIELEIVA